MAVTISPAPSHALRAPDALALPVKRGKMARIPERWTGPLSQAPFEVQVDADGSLALGVGFVCPKGQRRTGSLWLSCTDGPELVDRAMAIDAALAAAHGRHTPDAKGRVGKIALARLLETLSWVEHGAGQAAVTTIALRTSGARSLFTDVAKALKKALAHSAETMGGLSAGGLMDGRSSATCH